MKLNACNIYYLALWEKFAKPSLEQEGFHTRVVPLQSLVFLDHWERGRTI